MTLIGANIDLTRTSSEPHQLFGLGDKVTEKGGKEYIFIQASGALGANDVVIIDETGQAVVANTTNSATAKGDRVAVVLTDYADNEYGFAQIYGASTINAKASCAANAAINTTGTAGHLDDDGASGAEAIDGIVLTTARGGSDGTAAAMLNYPTVGATL